MGEKFDKRLPTMTDGELAAVDETKISKKSRNHLEIERRKRDFKSGTGHTKESRRRFNITTLVAAAGVVIAALGLIAFWPQ